MHPNQSNTVMGGTANTTTTTFSYSLNHYYDAPELPADRFYPASEVTSQMLHERRAKYAKDARALHDELNVVFEFGLGRKNELYHIDLIAMLKRFLGNVNMEAWEKSTGLFDWDKAEKLQNECSDKNGKFADVKTNTDEVCRMHRLNKVKGMRSCPKMGHMKQQRRPQMPPSIPHAQCVPKVPDSIRRGNTPRARSIAPAPGIERQVPVQMQHSHGAQKASSMMLQEHSPHGIHGAVTVGTQQRQPPRLATPSPIQTQLPGRDLRTIPNNFQHTQNRFDSLSSTLNPPPVPVSAPAATSQGKKRSFVDQSDEDATPTADIARKKARQSSGPLPSPAPSGESPSQLTSRSASRSATPVLIPPAMPTMASTPSPSSLHPLPSRHVSALGSPFMSTYDTHFAQEWMPNPATVSQNPTSSTICCRTSPPLVLTSAGSPCRPNISTYAQPISGPYSLGPLWVQTTDGEYVRVAGVERMSDGSVKRSDTGAMYPWVQFLQVFDVKRMANGLSLSRM